MTLAAKAIDDTSELHFEEGIIGVPEARHFQLLARPDSPIRVLCSTDLPGFNLPVVDPTLVDPDYRPELSRRLAEALGFDEQSELLILAVTTIEPEGPMANLRAPIVINVARRCGAQVILDDRRLPLRAKLVAETV